MAFDGIVTYHLSRGEEDLGRAELLHSAGAGPGARLVAQVINVVLISCTRNPRAMAFS